MQLVSLKKKFFHLSMFFTLSASLAMGFAGNTSFGQGIVASPRAPDMTPDYALNRLQFIGTHNSYHIAPSAKLRSLIETLAPGQGQALDYSHRPLTQQLEVLGVRQIELDLFNDPQGGLFSNPLSSRLPGEATQKVDPLWKSPGFKVFHSPDFDQNTTVVTLRLALRELRAWSQRNPHHEPVMMLLELKNESFSAASPPPFDQSALIALEAEIRSELPASNILTPDEVRGSFASLREAVTKRGWPLLSKARGKFIFALDNEDAVRDLYLSLSPGNDLHGRACFVSVAPDHRAAAWMKRNDPIRSFDEIRALVAAGFMVRTRADSDLKEVLANDRTRQNAALSSGAQWISTDAPEPRSQPANSPTNSGYQLSWPNRAPWRLNPVAPKIRATRSPKSPRFRVEKRPFKQQKDDTEPIFRGADHRHPPRFIFFGRSKTFSPSPNSGRVPL